MPSQECDSNSFNVPARLPSARSVLLKLFHTLADGFKVCFWCIIDGSGV